MSGSSCTCFHFRVAGVKGRMSLVACSGQAIADDFLYEAVFLQLALILHVSFGIGTSSDSSESTTGDTKDCWNKSSPTLRAPKSGAVSLSELNCRQGKTNLYQFENFKQGLTSVEKCSTLVDSSEFDNGKMKEGQLEECPEFKENNLKGGRGTYPEEEIFCQQRKDIKPPQVVIEEGRRTR